MRLPGSGRAWACALGIAAMLAGTADPSTAQPRAEVRGFWVDTFNTALNNHADVVTVVSQAMAAKANTIFAQVRRRGDSWYLNSLEPMGDRTPIQAGFDPLQDLLDEAHANGLEVHAFIAVNTIWGRAPNLFPPENPNHVFNQHGGFDAATNTIVPGPNNWLTRTLLPDGSGITYQGHRIGSDFWSDPGHPDAAQYTVDVLMHLVRNYDIDGLHLDRIRYPELSVAGQTPTTGTNIGYNPTSVARFQRRYGIPEGSAPPAPNNAQWSQWRRDQVTNLVRRIYLDAVAIRPDLKVSGAFIAFGSGPLTEAGWLSAEAYWRVYQDWRAWTEEGIVDIAIPMIYQREHQPTGATAFDRWNDWLRTHQYGRATMMGVGSFINAIEGSLRQVRRALQPTAAGQANLGVNLYSMATSNVAVTANPFAIPPGNTPARPFAEFASGLATGGSTNGLTRYEDPSLTPVFAEAAAIPPLPWKTGPQVGHLRGTIRDESGAIVDAGAVAIARVADDTTPAAGRTAVNTASDGNGYYGGVDLAPGTFQVTVTPAGQAPYTSACTAPVAAGQVATFDVTIDRSAPGGTLAADPAEITPPDNRMTPVTLGGNLTDLGTGIASVTFRVIDEYGEVQPAVESLTAAGETALTFSRTFELQASRRGHDRDGRTYTLEAVVTDRACNVTTLTTSVVVAHDQGQRGEGN